MALGKIFIINGLTHCAKEIEIMGESVWEGMGGGGEEKKKNKKNINV